MLSSRTSLMEEIDAAPGVLPFTEAVLGGRGVAVPDDRAGLEPDTVRLTPSETDARGLGVVDDFSAAAAAPASGEAMEALGVGLAGAPAARPGVGVAALVAVAAGVGAFAAGTDALGARDVRRDGAGGGGIAFEAAVVGLAAAEAVGVGLVAGVALVLAVFLRVVAALAVGFAAVGAAVALVAAGGCLTVPDPNVPELMI